MLQRIIRGFIQPSLNPPSYLISSHLNVEWVFKFVKASPRWYLTHSTCYLHALVFFAFTFSGCQFQFLFLSCFGSGTPLFICLPVCCDTTYGSSSELLVMRVNYNFKWKKPLTISMMQLGSTFCFFGKWKRGWKPDREGVRWMDCM